MKIVSRSLLRLAILSAVFCLITKPIRAEDEEGIEKDLVEDDLEEEELDENDAEIEEQSEEDEDLFDDEGDDEDDEEDFVMHKGKLSASLTRRLHSRQTHHVW